VVVKVGGGLLACRWRTTVLRHSLLTSADCCHPMAPWRVTEDVRVFAIRGHVSALSVVWSMLV
jgi:hypothetical protein